METKVDIIGVETIDIIRDRDYIIEELIDAEKGETISLDSFSRKLISKFNIEY